MLTVQSKLIRAALGRLPWCVAFCAVIPAFAADWSSWRGPEQSGFVREKAVVKSWSPDGQNLIWKSTEGGRTTPIVMNGRVFFIGPVGDESCLQERVICLEAQTGKTRWEYRFNVNFSDIVANRVGWTSLVGDPETGNLYAHGTGGEFLCLSRDGKLLWQRSLMQEFNRVSGYGGRLMNPIIDEDRVIISFLNTNWGNHAKPCHRFLAMDKHTGAVVWWAEPGGPPADTTYAIPLTMVVNGRRMLIAPNADGKIYGMEARSGRVIWSFALSKVGLNASPVTDGRYVYMTHSEENLDTTLMGRLVCIDPAKSGDITKSGEVWRIDGLDAGYASPAIANGRLYIVDNSAMLYCVDTKTRQKAWQHKLGRVGKGSAVATLDGVIYVGEQNGVFYILKDKGDSCEVLSRVAFEGPDKTVDELFGSPAVVDGRVYFMTRYTSYCLGMKDANVEREPIPDMPSEASASNQKPTTLFVVPGDVTLAPGETIRFEARVVGSGGAWLESSSSEAQWSMTVIKGAIGKDGTFTAPSDSGFSAGLITAKLGDHTAITRVRITPKIPINENFEKMALDVPPPGWSGTAGKTKIVEHEGSKCFKKLAEKGKPSPVWKMRAYSGPPMAGGYTLQADLWGTASRRFKPDMGLINSGYEMVLMGMQKQLELSRWRDEPTHALRRRQPMEMTTGTWYRMKLRVEMKNGMAKVSGKVWLREETEPQEWTISFDDPCPNTAGSPGLFVYSNGTTDKSDGAEVFVDNYQVYPND